eukprot:TRINITY_DN1195_c0_g1_i1.p1 TRINITY_DN1195_c0_g1~~TRINITY_DN1195_c0_g1_i1.p1  ORF type:complete len:113 (-),score=19.17 TRINITY_DN1195_c0_g1_i1:56-394(-)
MATLVVFGVGLAGLSFAARGALKGWAVFGRTFTKQVVKKVTGPKYPDSGFNTAMDAQEASLILGLRSYSTAKNIRTAHIKLIRANHPDSGGSDYIASKINQAKDVLLQEIHI